MIRSARFAPLVLLVAACPALAQTEPATPAVATVATPTNLPVAIADLFAPRDLIAEKTVKNFDATFTKALAADPASATMEGEFPGLSDAVSAAVQALLIDSLDAHLGELQTKLADVFGNNLDFVEQKQIYAFMASPLGHKIVAMGDQIYRTDKLAKDLAAKPGAPQLTGKQLADSVDYGFVEKLTPEDMAEATRFGLSAGGQKLVELTPQLQQIVAEWVNGFLAELEPGIEQTAAQTVGDFIAKAGGEQPAPPASTDPKE